MNEDRQVTVTFAGNAPSSRLVLPLKVDETLLGSSLSRFRHGMARFAAGGQIGTADAVERARRTGARC